MNPSSFTKTSFCSTEIDNITTNECKQYILNSLRSKKIFIISQDITSQVDRGIGISRIFPIYNIICPVYLSEMMSTERWHLLPNMQLDRRSTSRVLGHLRSSIHRS